MPELSPTLQEQLELRIREQLACELRRDVSALYDFTVPAIRAARVAERADEPGLSLDAIAAFVATVDAATLESIRVDEFHASAPVHAGCPAAVVVTRVRYNARPRADEFRTVWVLVGGTWYTTALSRERFA